MRFTFRFISVLWRQTSRGLVVIEEARVEPKTPRGGRIDVGLTRREVISRGRLSKRVIQRPGRTSSTIASGRSSLANRAHVDVVGGEGSVRCELLPCDSPSPEVDESADKEYRNGTESCEEPLLRGDQTGHMRVPRITGIFVVLLGFGFGFPGLSWEGWLGVLTGCVAVVSG